MAQGDCYRTTRPRQSPARGQSEGVWDVEGSYRVVSFTNLIQTA